MSKISFSTFIFFVTLSSLLFSCGNNKKGATVSTDTKDENPLYNEVMAIHDAVMPEMGTIHAYKKELKSMMDSTKDNTAILDVIQQLNQADDGMMDWMAVFKVPSNKDSVTHYLENEKIKIQKVSDDMYASMSEAKTLIDSLKQIK